MVQYGVIIKNNVSVNPPPLTPPARGGGKRFLPLDGGGQVGVLNCYKIMD